MSENQTPAPENLRIYNAVKAVPDNAKRTITGGKLKGKTEINPMWRIKRLTELFGPVGIGWNTTDVQYQILPGASGEAVVVCSLGLVYREKPGSEWSAPVFGVGGSMLIATEKGNLVSNDEAHKMAYTDAISVAAKALGIGASVYWDKDTGSSKYQTEPAPPAAPPPVYLCRKCGKKITGVQLASGKKQTPREVSEKLGGLCVACYRAENPPAQPAPAEPAAGPGVKIPDNIQAV